MLSEVPARYPGIYIPIKIASAREMPALLFRAEKRSAQASAQPLSQAQGGLFCVLTVVFVLFVTESM